MDWMTAPIIWRALLVAVVGDLTVPFAMAIAWPGYSHKRQVMSELGADSSPIGKWYGRWLVLAGVLMLLGAMGLFRLYAGGDMALRMALLLIMTAYAVGGCILSGMFSVNLEGEEKGTVHNIHGTGSALGFTAMVFAPLVISRLAAGAEDRATNWIAMACFFGALVSFVLFVASEREGPLRQWTGLLQRLALLFMYLPLIWVGAWQLV